MHADLDVIARVAELADVEALCAFGKAHIGAHYEPLIGAEAAARQIADWWNPAVMTQAVAQGQVIVAESGRQLVAVAQVSDAVEPPTIYKLYAHPAWRGRGVGPVLLDAVVASLPPGTPRLAIEHFAANERAGRFYDRQGFVVDHVSEDPSGDPRLAIVWRVRTLDSITPT